jgi:hypothetical protein
MARQRQGATGLANRTVEQVREPPFDMLQAGLSTDDLAGSSNPAMTSGCSATYCYGGERIPRSATRSPSNPTSRTTRPPMRSGCR